MKCPHCGYMHGVNWVTPVNVVGQPIPDREDELKFVDGDCGGFYTLPVKMERSWSSDVTLCACPSCSKTFIDNVY